jgi:hypothetical protein
MAREALSIAREKRQCDRANKGGPVMLRALALLMPLLAMAAPATAGSRAVYEGMPGPPIVIEVGDNGDARIGAEGKEEYGLLIGSEFYIVGKEKGAWTVARIADQAAAFDKVLPPIFRTIFSAAGKGTVSKLKIVKTGTRTVVGIAGDVYAVTGLDPEKPAEVTELVITRDPKLAPAGRALAGFNDAMMVMMAPLIGEMAANEIRQNREIAALGTPLDTRNGLRLKTFSEATVDPARLVLPAKPQTVEQIVAGIKVTPIDGK